MTARLDYLAALGVNALELLPVHEFNELEYYAQIPGSNPPAYRHNFWGYSTVGFFAPMSRWVSGCEGVGGVGELRGSAVWGVSRGVGKEVWR